MTKQKVRLGLDVDGVLYRWSDTARYLLETYWNIDVGESQHWDWIKDHVTKEAWKWLWSDAITNHGLYRYGSIYKGSREFLYRMQKYCDNVIITSRPSIAASDTMDWLVYQRVPTTEVHIVGAKQSKADIMPQCDIYIDDAEHNCEDLLAKTKAKIIMPDRPWNQKEINHERLFRTYSWKEMVKIIRATYRELNTGE